jgi:hypothetical protein
MGVGRRAESKHTIARKNSVLYISFNTLSRYSTLNDWLFFMRIFLSFLSDKEVQASQELNKMESNEDTFANIIIEVLRYARRLHNHYQHHP